MPQIRVFVSIVILHFGEQIIAPMANKLTARRGAKSDRVGHAIIANGNTIVRDARGDVENVAGLENPFFQGFEAGKQAQIIVRQERGGKIALRANLPSTFAQALDQEHVILVKMWPDAPFIGCIADHHIVDTPIGYEAKRLDQRGNLWHMVIDRLDEQRPRLVAESAKARFRERSVFRFPRIARLHDEPRFNIFFAGEAREFIRLERIDP